MMSRSNDARLLARGGLGALCLSAVWGCTGMVAGSGLGMGDGSAGAGATSPMTNGGNGSGGADPVPVDPGNVVIHRLNTAEYNHTVADVLGTTQQPGTPLWANEETANFDNIAAVANVDDKQYERYYDAAGTVARDVFSNATLKSRIVTCEQADDAPCVRGIIAATGRRLFRRPLSDDEVATYQKVYSALRAASTSHDDSLEQVLVALLASAEFLFRMEFDADPASPAVHPLGGYELASRLSYFLWQSAPDDALLNAAAKGTLNDTEALQAELGRLSSDAKFTRFSRTFVGEWLGVQLVPSHAVNAGVFPSWNPALGTSMAEEVYSFFDEFSRNARPWPEFISADVNYVDDTLATFYGLPVSGSGTQRIENKNDHRVGFLGMGAFLALSSYDYRTAPTLRGRWILLNLLCAKPTQPLPGAGDLDPAGATADASQQNVRKRLEEHRSKPICASCHKDLDPYGLALENFDAIGRYRASYPDGTTIDASTELSDGTQFTGLQGAVDNVSKDPALLSCVEKKLFTYSLGRELTNADTPYLAQIKQSWVTGSPTLPRLIEGLVLADTFRKRHGG